MKLLPLHKLGAREVTPGVIDFGFYLPGVSAAEGNRLFVKIISEHDQFLQHVQPREFELSHAVDPLYGDYWSGEVEVRPDAVATPGSSWGKPGRYVYRYALQRPGSTKLIDWIIDPFAREFGIGKLSAIKLGYKPYVWSPGEKEWHVPSLHDLVLYELMITEFGNDVAGTISRLDYLADLGINCIEVMPVTNVSNTVDWGFLPIGYFGVDERFGRRDDFQRLVDEAHQRGIAVILDAVYGHTSDTFPYCYVYRQLADRENPFLGAFAKNYFGESTDFNRAFTRDFFYTVNHHWLDCYHVDGFRYDCVPNYWDGPVGNGYSALTYETYQLVKEKRADEYWKRFSQNGDLNIIQCAEQLEDPEGVLRMSYSNCTWQDGTLGVSEAVARGSQNELSALGLRLGLNGLPEESVHNTDIVKKTGLQYVENHDHARFLCNFRTLSRDNELLGEGDRNLWFKVQPYLIGIFTAKGIPMIWQGQEFGENYLVPDQGWGRVMLFRPVRWDYFYDPVGKSTIALVRKLIGLRKKSSQFTEGRHYFYNHFEKYQSKNVVLFSRENNGTFSLVALNFGDHDQQISFRFPSSGDYLEDLHGYDNLHGVSADQETWLTVPSNYGRIWTLSP